MIGIVDYEMGNIFSIRAALDRLGAKHRLVASSSDMQECTSLILPGVGAFGDAMKNLHKKELIIPILEWVKMDKPLLGICLGMQLLFCESEEHGNHKGLGLITGKIKKIPPVVKVPHMGWNDLKIKQESWIFEGIEEGYVYFVHSYYVDTNADNILATASYSLDVPAVVGRKNIIGMQFHPEKSGQEGMKLLTNWVKYFEEEKR